MVHELRRMAFPLLALLDVFADLQLGQLTSAQRT